MAGRGGKPRRSSGKKKQGTLDAHLRHKRKHSEIAGGTRAGPAEELDAREMAEQLRHKDEKIARLEAELKVRQLQEQLKQAQNENAGLKLTLASQSQPQLSEVALVPAPPAPKVDDDNAELDKLVAKERAEWPPGADDRLELWMTLNNLRKNTDAAMLLGRGTNLPAFYAKAWGSSTPPYDGVTGVKGWSLEHRCRCLGSPPSSIRVVGRNNRNGNQGKWYVCCHLNSKAVQGSATAKTGWEKGCGFYEQFQSLRNGKPVKPRGLNVYNHAVESPKAGEDYFIVPEQALAREEEEESSAVSSDEEEAGLSAVSSDEEESASPSFVTSDSLRSLGEQLNSWSDDGLDDEQEAGSEDEDDPPYHPESEPVTDWDQSHYRALARKDRKD